MILLVCIALGLLLRVACGRSIRDLSTLRIRGELVLLSFLAVQAAIPLVRLGGSLARAAFLLWLATFPVLVGVAWMNRRSPGMPLLAAGLIMNLVVVGLNQGMPVVSAAASLANPDLVELIIPSTDFIHLVAGERTIAIWLADAIPVVGPTFVQSVVSPGDCLLFAGIVAFLATADGGQRVKSAALRA